VRLDGDQQIHDLDVVQLIVAAQERREGRDVQT